MECRQKILYLAGSVLFFGLIIIILIPRRQPGASSAGGRASAGTPEKGSNKKKRQTPTPPQVDPLLTPPPQKASYLIINTGPNSGKEYRLQATTTIGRDAEQCDIVLSDPTCAGRQVKIVKENDNFFLYSLTRPGSTKVNNTSIHRHRLADGDRILLGQTEFAFVQMYV